MSFKALSISFPHLVNNIIHLLSSRYGCFVNGGKGGLLLLRPLLLGPEKLGLVLTP